MLSQEQKVPLSFDESKALYTRLAHDFAATAVLDEDCGHLFKIALPILEPEGRWSDGMPEEVKFVDQMAKRTELAGHVMWNGVLPSPEGTPWICPNSSMSIASSASPESKPCTKTRLCHSCVERMSDYNWPDWRDCDLSLGFNGISDLQVTLRPDTETPRLWPTLRGSTVETGATGVIAASIGDTSDCSKSLKPQTSQATLTQMIKTLV
ncbi:hypothetical protein C8J56DRAFT_899046 [Mycena floridula]|nr:hypothetical protein C8J56DRAFT_899046 [Mycena floridula]